MPWTPTPPHGDLSSVEVALWHLRVALDDKGATPTRADPELRAQLELDRVDLRPVTGTTATPYYRPWETGARILELTEYEVGGELQSRTDRKIISLRRTQAMTDVRYGYPGIPGPDGTPTDPFGATISWGDRR